MNDFLFLYMFGSVIYGLGSLVAYWQKRTGKRLDREFERLVRRLFKK